MVPGTERIPTFDLQTEQLQAEPDVAHSEKLRT